MLGVVELYFHIVKSWLQQFIARDLAVLTELWRFSNVTSNQILYGEGKAKHYHNGDDDHPGLVAIKTRVILWPIAPYWLDSLETLLHWSLRWRSGTKKRIEYPHHGQRLFSHWSSQSSRLWQETTDRNQMYLCNIQIMRMKVKWWIFHGNRRTGSSLQCQQIQRQMNLSKGSTLWGTHEC